MSAHINLSENTWETNRDTCAQIPPALSNKPLERKAMLDNVEQIQKQKWVDEVEVQDLTEKKMQAF